ncbi:hypothetical protein T12_11412 [Trichinella patagoniensis]|uniref:Uncharacterized protein n=1 Tax=Trichinella patagoniensis TaxID=990121 RepID=A0A0V1A5S1_9BILA|nr:hypothetical protein T12_11412 [Trichinella patagoniensis]
MPNRRYWSELARGQRPISEQWDRVRTPQCHHWIPLAACSQLRDGVKGCRPVSFPLIPELKDKLESLENRGIIQKPTAPSEW